MKFLVLPLILIGVFFYVPSQGQAVHTDYRAFDPKAPVPVHPSPMYCAELVDYSVRIFRKHHEAHLITGLPDDFHYDIRQWQQRDVTEFATCPETYDVFETLLGIANQAVEANGDGQYSLGAVEAQNALSYLKPDGCKSWKGFYNLIANAADKTQSKRDQYRKTAKRR